MQIRLLRLTSATWTLPRIPVHNLSNRAWVEGHGVTPAAQAPGIFAGPPSASSFVSNNSVSYSCVPSLLAAVSALTGHLGTLCLALVLTG